MTPSPPRRTSVLLAVATLLLASDCFASPYERNRPTTGKGQFRGALGLTLLRGLKKDEETLSPTAAPTEKKSMNNKNKYETVSPTQTPADNGKREEGENFLQNDDWIEYDAPVKTDEPTEEPTAEPTEEPTPEPTAEPTAVPTRSPTVSPTQVPTLSPTSYPTFWPSSAPSSAPTLTQHKVILNDFSILLVSPNGPVHVSELERSMAEYILHGILFDNIKSVGLNIIEGNSVAEEPSIGNNTATSVRFSAFAIFNSFLPDLLDIRAEQTYLLEQREEVQRYIDQNEALKGATVTKVSFDRISNSGTYDFKDKDQVKTSASVGIGISILVVVVVISSLSVLGGILALRMFKVQHKAKTVEKSKPKKTKKQIMKEETPKGCASLVSGSVSLGGDSRLTAQYQYPTTLNGIIIETTDSMDEDDAYLTMDEDIANAIEGL